MQQSKANGRQRGLEKGIERKVGVWEERGSLQGRKDRDDDEKSAVT